MHNNNGFNGMLTTPRPQTPKDTTTMTPRTLSAQEDGSITYTDADDITVVEPITHPVQTAGGYTRHEPDHELAALMAAAPDLLAALQAIIEDWNWEPTVYCPEVAAKLIAARNAIARATNPDYVQNGTGRTLHNTEE